MLPDSRLQWQQVRRQPPPTDLMAEELEHVAGDLSRYAIVGAVNGELRSGVFVSTISDDLVRIAPQVRHPDAIRGWRISIGLRCGGRAVP